MKQHHMDTETSQLEKSASNDSTIFFCLARGYPVSKKYKYLKLVLRNIFLKKHSKEYKKSSNWIFHEGDIDFFDQFIVKLFSSSLTYLSNLLPLIISFGQGDLNMGWDTH